MKRRKSTSKAKTKKEDRKCINELEMHVGAAQKQPSQASKFPHCATVKRRFGRRNQNFLLLSLAVARAAIVAVLWDKANCVMLRFATEWPSLSYFSSLVR
ncbi:hypothetical protein AVEN_52339-1 [Araneus ventricosus]|uniref:Uncharacterized protein n=1 Tax=Araneus ventricosus TaxID=182803 RepID=A0A4Y2QEL8_ARAVE|nr:hypothetical protein AVEN_52339-1 [Araneus ventricosus]